MMLTGKPHKGNGVLLFVVNMRVTRAKQYTLDEVYLLFTQNMLQCR